MHSHAIVASLSSFALVAAGHVAAVRANAPSAAYRAPRALVSSVSTLTDGPQEAALLRVARAPRDMGSFPLTIVGDVPHAAKATRLMWACGPVEANRIGGSQRTCEWR